MPSPVALSGSLLPVALRAQVVSELQVTEAMTAVGGLLLAGSVMVTSRLAVLHLPHTSVAVRTIVYVPGTE
jgi:hypothetical protein